MNGHNPDPAAGEEGTPDLYVCLDCGQPCRLTAAGDGPEYQHFYSQAKGMFCPEFWFPVNLARLNMGEKAQATYLRRWEASPFVKAEQRKPWPADA